MSPVGVSSAARLRSQPSRDYTLVEALVTVGNKRMQLTGASGLRNLGL